MLSQKCKYSLRTLFFLASGPDKNLKKSLKALSEELKIPMHYLGKILQELVHKNVVSSAKGPNGGFFLTPQNLEFPLMKIIEIIDGLEVFNACGLGLESCSSEKPCPIHNDYILVRDKLKQTFENKRVIDLANEIRDNDFALVR